MKKQPKKTPVAKKPVARKLKAKWQLPMKIQLNWVAILPPPTELKACPRCEKPHKKLKPLKFAKPMLILDSTGKLTAKASHWFACPKTKEPVILFDRVDAGESLLNLVQQQAVQDIQKAEDKVFLDSISALVGKKPKGSKGSKKPKRAPKTETVVTAQATLSDMQTWSWSLEDPPGVLKKGAKPTAPEPGRKTATKGKKR